MWIPRLNPKKHRKVALLATGDELTYGDILNTNAQHIAMQLTEHHIEVGLHVISSDELQDIAHTIVFLLKNHDSVIITGGLGPTSDDRTRFALSKAVRRPLVFDQPSWERIVDRIQRYSGRTAPESNRQQALFPKGASIFENPHGTASGCGLALSQGKGFLFMLPGPPHECLPMFQEHVLPLLIKIGYPQEMYRKKWLLFNVSEGQIAEALDRLMDPYGVSTGYRIAYPYVEFKIHGRDKATFDKAVQCVQAYVAPHQLGNGVEPISVTLTRALESSQMKLSIQDAVTGGLLESLLSKPTTTDTITFHQVPSSPETLAVAITGLEDYWAGHTEIKTADIRLQFSGKMTTLIQKTIPWRGKQPLLIAIEIICRELLDILCVDETNA